MRVFIRALGLFVVHGSFAQVPVEVADQRAQIVRYDRVLAGASGEWIFAGVQQAWSEARTLLVARSDDGAVLWESPVDVPDAAFFPRVMAPLPDGFVLGGAPIECSLPIGLHHLQRRRFDGTLLWTILLDEVAPASISISNNGLIALGDDPQEDEPLVHLLDENGGQHAMWTVPWPLLQAVRWSPDGTLITLNDGMLARWSDDGLLLDQSTIPIGAVDLVALDEDELRILHADRLVRYDGSLNAVDSISFGGLSEARWMEYSDGLFRVTCAEEFVAVDPLSAIVASFGSALVDGHAVNGTAVRDGLIMTAGTASVDGRSGGVMRSCTTLGQFAQHDEDVAISIASVDSLHFEVFDQFPQIVRVHAQVTILVENYGTQVLDKLLLNTQRTVGYCGADFGATVQPSAMQIAPGASALVQMPLIVSLPYTVPVGDTLHFEQCFVALSPNDRVDRDPTDNRTCLEASFSNTTSIGEQHAFGGAMISPVPFNDHFVIQLGSIPGTNAVLIINDATGRMIARKQWDPGQTRMMVSAADLPAGVLMVLVEDGGQRLVRRVVRTP